MAFTHTRFSYEKYHTFVNRVETNQGGTHIQAFQEAMTYVLTEIYQSGGMAPENTHSNLVVALSIRIEIPRFEYANEWK